MQITQLLMQITQLLMQITQLLMQIIYFIDNNYPPEDSDKCQELCHIDIRNSSGALILTIFKFVDNECNN